METQVYTSIQYDGSRYPRASFKKKKTSASARIAGAFFTVFRANGENSADTLVLFPHIMVEVSAMTPEQFDREKKYLAALAIARAMLKKGIINADDYAKTEKVLRVKFCPLMGVFQTKIP